MTIRGTAWLLGRERPARREASAAKGRMGGFPPEYL